MRIKAGVAEYPGIGGDGWTLAEPYYVTVLLDVDSTVRMGIPVV